MPPARSHRIGYKDDLSDLAETVEKVHIGLFCKRKRPILEAIYQEWQYLGLFQQSRRISDSDAVLTNLCPNAEQTVQDKGGAPEVTLADIALGLESAAAWKLNLRR